MKSEKFATAMITIENNQEGFVELLRNYVRGGYNTIPAIITRQYPPIPVTSNSTGIYIS